MMEGLPSKSTKTRLVRGKKFTMLVERGSASVKQGTCFSNVAISSSLGARGGTGAPFSSRLSQAGAGLVKAPSRSGQTSFLVEGLGSGTLLSPATSARGIGARRASEIGSIQGSSTQDLLVRGRATTMDSKRHLRCLSLNPSQRFVAMSSSFSSASQMI